MNVPLPCGISQGDVTWASRRCPVQYYFPLSSDKAVTAWIPLQPTPAEMGPLQFAAGSHKVDVGRHLGISGANQQIIDRVRPEDLRVRLPCGLLAYSGAHKSLRFSNNAAYLFVPTGGTHGI